MISERSCDTENWSNHAENSALDHVLKYIKIEYLIKITVIFLFVFFTVFWINAVILSIRDS